jgi:predicted RNA-binding Zn-ribbon protein involved in translation (DUF1610 family)
MIKFTQNLTFDINGAPMMIHKNHGQLSVECDSCGDQMDTDDQYTVEEFNDFVKVIKSEGWQISKEGDEWRHTCPNCEGEDR